MKIRFFEIDIRVSELQTTRVSVASWEYPVLQAIWGASASFVQEVLVERKSTPDPADEFRRLANRYGSSEVEGPPYISAVYGQFGPGVAALAKAVEESVYGGDIAISARKASDVPTPDQIPSGVVRSVADIEKELEAAKALQADLAIAQKDGANNVPLSQPEADLVERVSGVGQAKPSVEAPAPFVLDESDLASDLI